MKIKISRKRRILYWVMVIGIGFGSFGMGRTSIHSQRQAFANVPKETSQSKSPIKEESGTVIVTPIVNTQPLEEELQDKYLSTFDKNGKELLLVNKENPVPDTYELNLVPLGDGKSQVADFIVEAASQMLADGTSQGLSFNVTSSFRAKEKQQQLIEEDVATFMRSGMTNEEAYAETLTETMPAGHSEHQTGLALDIVASGTSKLNEQEENTPENHWLRENCVNYGFILRYPKDKVEITKINYEPWHFRYVGVEAAKYITENNLTLEEFIALLP